MNPVQLFAFVVGVILFAVIYNIWQNERIKKIQEENKNEFDD